MKVTTAQLTTHCSRCGAKIFSGELMLVEHHARMLETECWCGECASEYRGEE